MKYVLLLVFTVFSLSASAQQANVPAQPKPALKDRLFFGGDLGASFGNYTTVYIAPIIGYRITPKWGAGLGPSYSYINDKRYVGYEYETSSYGARMFTQYNIIPQLLLYGEAAWVNAEVFDDFSYDYIREDIFSILLGGGYTQQLGQRSGLSLMILFNVLEDEYTYYENPIFRAGFNVGF